MLKFNGVELTNETIQKTRKWFSDNAIACIEEVKNGKVMVNDQNSYFEMRNKQAKEYIEGKHAITFTFLQRAYFIQTGESVALLS
jgi:NOL1/NOP2/fmu family ribosome biogenesis protein